jgi:hypothetical protein
MNTGKEKEISSMEVYIVYIDDETSTEFSNAALIRLKYGYSQCDYIPY